MQRRSRPRSLNDLLWGWSWVSALAVLWLGGFLLRALWYLWGDRLRRAWNSAVAPLHSALVYFLHNPKGMALTVIALTLLLLALHNQQTTVPPAHVASPGGPTQEYRAQTIDLPKPTRHHYDKGSSLLSPPASAVALRRPLSVRARHRKRQSKKRPDPSVPDAAARREEEKEDEWPRCGTWREPQSRSQRHWAFCHMPKTGGMTMRTVLERGARADGHHVTHLAKNYDTPRCAMGSGGAHCRGILGTQSLPQLRKAFPKHRPTLITMLREPVERSYSAYHYVLRERNKPIHPLYKANTLEALLRGQRFYNDIGLGRNAYTRVLSDFLPDRAQQCRQLKNHTGQWSDRLEGDPYWDCLLAIAKTVLRRHMHLVCVTERYAECLELAATELFPAWLGGRHIQRIPRRNAARQPHSSRSPRVDAMLRHANRQDRELYSYAHALFDCRWKRHARRTALWSWGDNAHGQLGHGQKSSSSVYMQTRVDRPQLPASLIQVGGGGGVWDWSARNPAVCGAFSLALAANGTLYSAGWNKWNLLGRQGARRGASDDPLFGPVAVPGNVNVSSFAAGHRHALAVLEPRGRVAAWGMNGYGQLGTGQPPQSRSPHLAPSPALVRGLPRDIVQVAAGGRHSLALSRSGQVWVWGLNDADMLGLGMAAQHIKTPQRIKRMLEHEPVVQVCAGTRHSAALTRRGALYEWGWKTCAAQQMRLCKQPYFRRTELPDGAQQIVQLSCTGGATFVIDAVGGLYGWGTNAVCELGLGWPKEAGEHVDQPTRIEGLPPLAGVWPSYDYTPGFHGGPTLALSADYKELWMWGPLGGSASDRLGGEQSERPGPRGSSASSTRGMTQAEARKRCQKRNDGHLGGQLERCIKLWENVAPTPVRVEHVGESRTRRRAPPSSSRRWAVAGLANRGSVFAVASL